MIEKDENNEEAEKIACKTIAKFRSLGLRSMILLFEEEKDKKDHWRMKITIEDKSMSTKFITQALYNALGMCFPYLEDSSKNPSLSKYAKEL